MDGAISAQPAQRGVLVAPASADGRLAWLDRARGICIVAVVTLYTATHVREALGTPSWLEYWVEFARPFRMPDFFFISGLLLGRVIDRPWRGFLDKKVAHYLYFFFAWSLIYLIARISLGHAGQGAAEIAAESFKVMTWGPFAMLWFIQMLPIYFVLTRLVRRVPWPVVLAAAAIWHMLPLDTPWTQVNRAGERFVFFFGGYALAAHVVTLAAWVQRHGAMTLVGLSAWALLNGAAVFSGQAERHGLSLVLGFSGALAVVAVSALLQRTGRMDWLRACGEQSLPIYLGFYIPMSAMMTIYLFAVRSAGWPGLEPGVLATLLAALSILIALAAAGSIRLTRLAWLYVRPQWARLDAAR